jgi:hypothetical protein
MHKRSLKTTPALPIQMTIQALSQSDATKAIFSIIESVTKPKELRPAIDFKSLVDEIEDSMLAQFSDISQVGLQVRNLFTKGLYVRECFIPAHRFVIGAEHKKEHVHTISKGRLLILTEANGLREYSAPYTGITKPGTRRVLLTLEDTIFSTYHPTDKTTVEEALEEYTIRPHNRI